MKGKEILSGWRNLLFTDEEVEKIAKERLDICNSCPSKCKLGGIEICKECYCPIQAKSRSLESNCPKDLWNKNKIFKKEK